MRKLSLVVLFGGYDRWVRFGPTRLLEASMSGIFAEVVAVINPPYAGYEAMIRQTLTTRSRPMASRIVFSPENNMPLARNLGVSAATGDDIMIWDDDDSVHPTNLRVAYRRYVESDASVMEVVLTHSDESSFHPQDENMMPQMSVAPDLIVLGMVHTPFFVRRDTVCRVAFPVHMALRGEWVDWSTRLWRAGIPTFCYTGLPVAREGDRDRASGATASAGVNGSSLKHVFSSMMFLAYAYEFEPDSFEGKILFRRYVERYCPDCGPDVWCDLLALGRQLRHTSYVLPGYMIFPGAYRHAAEEAYAHCRRELALERDAAYPLVYNIAPFGAFNPEHRQVLEAVLQTV
ncbi:MAG: glycosyltransferase [Candidatus Buchananbacteria bacterium]|nr:glycosyltransferase [Candidatus Buchananbacteria bacterium]